MKHIILVDMDGMPSTQPQQALALLKTQGILRLAEFTRHGITAATVRRLAQKGRVAQLARGLYQLPDAELDANHTLAEAAKLIPQGVICLTSALAYHELTDTIPSRAWICDRAEGLAAVH